MRRLIEMMVLLPAAGFALPVLIDSASKGVLLMALILIAIFLLRRSTAALRHLVLASSMVGLLLLPILSMTLPGWRILPAWSQSESQTSPPATGDIVATSSDFSALGPVSPVTPTIPPAVESNIIPWAQIAVLAWFVGATILSLRLALSQWALWRLSHDVTNCNCPKLQQTLTELKKSLHIRREIQLILHPDRAMPMTWGIFKTRLLLPAEATTWSRERTRAVLMHELAHVKRRDCLTQLLVQATTAIHWFNPLVWIAARRVAAERERACDDLVLNSGIRPSDYAEHLLRIATGYEDKPVAAAAALAMARKSSLEGRLTSILSRTTDRRTLSRRAALCAIAALALLATPVAMMRAVAHEEGETLEKLVAEWAHENLSEPEPENISSNFFEGPMITIKAAPNTIDSISLLEPSPKAPTFPLFLDEPGKIGKRTYLDTIDPRPYIVLYEFRPNGTRLGGMDFPGNYNYVDPLRKRALPASIDPLLLPERTSIGTDLEAIRHAPLGTITWTQSKQPIIPKTVQLDKLVDPWGKEYSIAPAGEAVESGTADYYIREFPKGIPQHAIKRYRELKSESASAITHYAKNHPERLSLEKEIANLEHFIIHTGKAAQKAEKARIERRNERDKTLTELRGGGLAKNHPTFQATQAEKRSIAGLSTMRPAPSYTYKKKLISLRHELARLKASGFGEKHPKIRSLDGQISTLENAVKKGVSGPLAARTFQLEQLRAGGFGTEHPKVIEVENEIAEIVRALSEPVIGIGITIHESGTGGFFVGSVLPGGPADRNGALRTSDQIIAVSDANGKLIETKDLELTELVAHIRGNAGTHIRMKLRPTNGDPEKLVELKREKLNLQANPHQPMITSPIIKQKGMPVPVLIQLKKTDVGRAKSTIDAILKNSSRGKVIAEPETNSLIYTGDEETLKLVRSMIEWLEK